MILPDDDGDDDNDDNADDDDDDGTDDDDPIQLINIYIHPKIFFSFSVFIIHDRYTPMMYPTIMKFNVDGVTLREQTFNCNKYTCSISLEQLRPRTSGAYRCEISGDSPEFKLVSETANMTVAGK